MLRKPPVLLFSGLAPGLAAARPIIVMGGGPGPSLEDTEASLSSPETSARPRTFRFSAVLSNEDRRSWKQPGQESLLHSICLRVLQPVLIKIENRHINMSRSIAFHRFSFTCETFISPLYMKSTMAEISRNEVSFKITIWLGSLKLTKSCSK